MENGGSRAGGELCALTSLNTCSCRFGDTYSDVLLRPKESMSARVGVITSGAG